jgi:hypothetical protein
VKAVIVLLSSPSCFNRVVSVAPIIVKASPEDIPMKNTASGPRSA